MISINRQMLKSRITSLVMLIIITLVVVIVLHPVAVMTADDRSMIINYRGYTWDTLAEPDFGQSWFYNSHDSGLYSNIVSFSVDLSAFLEEDGSSPWPGKPAPFSVTALLNSNVIPVDLAVIEGEEEYEGVYFATIQLPANPNGELVVTVSLLAENDWDIPPHDYTFNIIVDTINPVIEITGINNGEIFNDEAREVTVVISDTRVDIEATSIVVHRNEATHAVNFSLQESGGVLIYTYTFEAGSDTDGIYSITANAADKAGNQANQVILNFEIDRTGPEIDIDGVEDDEYYRTDRTVTVTIYDANGLVEENTGVIVTRLDAADEYVYADVEFDGNVATFGHNFIAGIGSFKIEVFAEDLLGNESNASLVFFMDRTPPVIELEGVVNDGRYTEDRMVTIKLSDDLRLRRRDSTVTVKRDGLGYNFPGWTESDNNLIASHTFSDGSYELTIVAVDMARNSTTLECAFLIDQTPPVIEINGVGNNEYYNYLAEGKDGINFNIIISDAHTNLVAARFSLNGEEHDIHDPDGSKQADYSSALITDEDTYLLEVYAEDELGNVDEISLTFTIDLTPPQVRFHQVESGALVEGEYYNENKQLTVTVTDRNNDKEATTIAITRNGSPYPVPDWVEEGEDLIFNHTLVQDGSYLVTVQSVDRAGNEAESKTVSFVIDKTPPEISFSGIDHEGHYNIDKMLFITVSDINMKAVELFPSREGVPIGVGSWSHNDTMTEYTLSYNFKKEDEGEYRIEVLAEDKAGNISRGVLVFTLDITPPVITPVFKGENRIIKDNEYINRFFTPEFRLDHTDDWLVSVTLNGSPDINNEIPLSSEETVYTYEVLAMDYAGNTSMLSITYTIDVTAPELSITGILPGFFNEDLRPIIAYSDENLDQDRSSVTLNNLPFSSGTLIAEENYYTLKAAIYDLADNATEQTIIFALDKTAPVITFLDAISNEYFNRDLVPRFIIESLTDYDIVNLTLNGEPYHPGTAISREGKHVLFIEAKDRAGNISSVMIEFIIDKTPPKIIFNGAEQNGRYYNEVELQISLENPADMFKSVTINGGLFEGEAVGTVVTTTLAELGEYVVEVTATDLAGNITNDKLTFTISEKGLIVQYYENTALFYSSIAAVIVLAGAGVFIIRIRRQPVIK